MDSRHVEGQLAHVLLTEEELHNRIAELALQIAADYPEDEDLLLVGVLKGAVMVMADLARALPRQAQMDWMAVSSYGSGTMSSGVVRILKDLDTRRILHQVTVLADERVGSVSLRLFLLKQLM